MFSFFNAYDKEDRVIEYLQRMVQIGKEYGVEMYHENEKKIFGDTVDRVLKIYNRVEGMKYIYDPANYIQCDQDADYAQNMLLDKTDYFHVKDVISQTGELVPAGYGDGKIPQIIERINGDCVFTIEPHLAIFDGYAAIDDDEMKNKFTFTSNIEAFNMAVKSFKEILLNCGYSEQGDKFVK